MRYDGLSRTHDANVLTCLGLTKRLGHETADAAKDATVITLGCPLTLLVLSQTRRVIDETRELTAPVFNGLVVFQLIEITLLVTLVVEVIHPHLSGIAADKHTEHFFFGGATVTTTHLHHAADLGQRALGFFCLGRDQLHDVVGQVGHPSFEVFGAAAKKTTTDGLNHLVLLILRQELLIGLLDKIRQASVLRYLWEIVNGDLADFSGGLQDVLQRKELPVVDFQVFLLPLEIDCSQVLVNPVDSLVRAGAHTHGLFVALLLQRFTNRLPSVVFFSHPLRLLELCRKDTTQLRLKCGLTAVGKLLLFAFISLEVFFPLTQRFFEEIWDVGRVARNRLRQCSFEFLDRGLDSHQRFFISVANPVRNARGKVSGLAITLGQGLNDLAFDVLGVEGLGYGCVQRRCSSLRDWRAIVFFFFKAKFKIIHVEVVINLNTVINLFVLHVWSIRHDDCLSKRIVLCLIFTGASEPARQRCTRRSIDLFFT